MRASLRSGALVLLFLASVICQRDTSVTIRPVGDGRYKAQLNSNPEQDVIVNQTGIVYSADFGGQWFSDPVDATAAQAAFKPQNATTVYQIAPNVFSAVISTHYPAVVYYGSSGAASFTCQPTVFGAFTCQSGGTLLVTFNAMGMENPDVLNNVVTLPVTFVISGSNPNSVQLQSSVLSLGFYRASMLRKLWDSGNEVVDWNSQRLSQAKGWGAGIMLLIAVSMEAVLVTTVTLISWLLSRNRLSKRINFLIWLLALFVIQQAVSIAGGFPGWLAMFIVLAFIFLILSITYTVVRSLKRKQVAPGVEEKEVTIVRPISMGSLELGLPAEPPPPRLGSVHWSTYPDELGSVQKVILIVLNLLVVLLMAICLIVFFVYKPKEYRLWDRRTFLPSAEFAPETVGKSTLLMYMFPRLATVLNFNLFAHYSTVYCGREFNKELSSDDAKKVAIQDNFITLYSIDMNQYQKPSYTQYSTVNEWFIRQLAPGARLIAAPDNSRIAVSPADCRLMVFENINSDLHVWLKNEEFLPYTLMNVDEASAAMFNGGTMVVARLAPADYHRFHSPVSGQVRSWRKVEGTILSVNADAATSGNRVYYNTRLVSTIESGEFGSVAYVAIGATCVGSVVTSVQEQPLKKGDEIGIMQFGGSTVVMLFVKGKLQLDPDLLFNSRRGLETRVYMGERIGTAM